jgi:hypothetical protein
MVAGSSVVRWGAGVGVEGPNTAMELGQKTRTLRSRAIADELGIAKSTCSETLHRAEGKIIREFVGEDGDSAL